MARGLHAELDRAGLSKRAALCTVVLEYISMATFVCAHGTAILTNRGASELVEEHIFYALQVRIRTIRKKKHLKFFVVYSIKRMLSFYFMKTSRSIHLRF